MSQEHGNEDAIEGVTEEVKGKAKEAWGALTDDDKLEREGEAQQDKAADQREAARKEVEAEKARARAEAHETEQRLNQS